MTQEELFKEGQRLQRRLQDLNAIVQNPLDSYIDENENLLEQFSQEYDEFEFDLFNWNLSIKNYLKGGN